MSMKEISALAMVVGSVVISIWVAMDLNGGGAAPDVSGAAWDMIWAIGYVVVINIIIVIIATIIVSIAQREEVKDERSDERDKLINGRAMGAAYFVLSVSILGVLFWQAFGLAPNLVPYALFGVSMLAGVAFAITQLVLYRVN